MSSQPAAGPAGVVLSQQQLQYILNGACFLGSGGGGPYSVGQQVLKYIGNRTVNLLTASAVPSTWNTAVSAFVGSPDAAANQNLNFAVATSAFNQLQQLLNTGFNCVLPGEVGAGNTLIPMAVAADRSIPVIDAAGACRAIPGFLMSTYAAANIPASPMMLTDGSSQVSLNCPNAIADPVVRGIISGNAFQEDAGIAFWSMSAQTMKNAALLGTTSEALGVGQTLAQAISQGQNPVNAVISYLQQYLGVSVYLLCTGTIIHAPESTSGGFDFGTVVIKADGGATVTIYNQNENLIAFTNESPIPLAMGPDLICYMTTSGQVFSNADISSIGNQKVALIGVPAPSMRLLPIIQQFLIALSGIGYGGMYFPIEHLNSMRKAA